MANRQLVLGLVLATAVLVILAGVTVYDLTRPPEQGGTPPVTSTCAGSGVYSGTVVNETGVGVPGAVVFLAATPPNVGTNATVPTDANGSWSANVSAGCAYTATAYWQSVADGPLLAKAVNVTASSTLEARVSWMNVTLTLISEFPHDANASVQAMVPEGFGFFVQANATGDIPLGFLPKDASGHAGYNFSEDGGFSSTGTQPFQVIRPAARAYRVQDVNGDSVVYAVPRLLASLGTVGASDPINMTAAIAQVQAQGGDPYLQLAPRGSMTLPFNITNATHLRVGVTAGIFGVALETYVTVRTNSTLQLGLRVQLVNTTNRTQCYIVTAEGASIHTWHYGVGACP